MKTSRPVSWCCGGLILAGFAAAQLSAMVPTFRKSTLDETFLAEGAAFGDFNNDGQLDAVAGPY